MIHEFHTYVSQPGRRPDLVERFTSGTLAIFARVGIEVLGFYIDADEEDRIHYLTSFPDEAARDAAWAAFQADEEWQELKRASQVDGPLVQTRASVTLRPVISVA